MRSGMMGGMHRNMMQRMMGGALPSGIDPALLPEPHSAGAMVLQDYCTQCHNLPDPRQHSAQEWPAVVERMRGHEAAMGKIVPDKTTTAEIIDFLRQHALTSGIRPLPGKARK